MRRPLWAEQKTGHLPGRPVSNTKPNRQCNTFKLLFFWLASSLPLQPLQTNRHQTRRRLAPGYGELGYVAPHAGSYRLPVLQQAADGAVIREDGRQRCACTSCTVTKLFYSALFTAPAAMSTVVHSPLRCSARIKQRLDRESELAAGLRLLSLSFDPTHDTPEVMQLYGQRVLAVVAASGIF